MIYLTAEHKFHRDVSKCPRCGSRALSMAKGCYKCYQMSNKDALQLKTQNEEQMHLFWHIGFYVVSTGIIGSALFSAIYRLFS